MTVTRPSQSSRPPRILIYSRQKKGKSLICASSKGLVIDPEHGTDWMAGSKLEPDVWHAPSWEDIDAAWKFCSQSKEATKYDWICIDGLTKLSRHALRYILRIRAERSLDKRPTPIGIKQRGDANEMMNSMVDNFHSLPKHGVLFTAQERVMAVGGSEDEDDDAEDSQMLYITALSPGVRTHVLSLVDVIGRLYLVPDPVRKGRHERRLWVSPSVSFDTGYRSKYALPQFIPHPTVPRIVRAMKEGKIDG